VLDPGDAIVVNQTFLCHNKCLFYFRTIFLVTYNQIEFPHMIRTLFLDLGVKCHLCLKVVKEFIFPDRKLASNLILDALCNIVDCIEDLDRLGFAVDLNCDTLFLVSHLLDVLKLFAVILDFIAACFGGHEILEVRSHEGL